MTIGYNLIEFAVWIGGIDILRVIAGTAKGHKLKTPKGVSTRPTSDRVKESLFNIIAGFLSGSDILDLFAGTGNLGIEALSRGARSAVFVDKSRECRGIIQDNLNHTKLMEFAEIYTTEVSDAIKRLSGSGRKFDVIFMDPPYNKNLVVETLNLVAVSDIMSENGILIAETDIDDPVPQEAGELILVKKQKYGDTVLSFYKQQQKCERKDSMEE